MEDAICAVAELWNTRPAPAPFIVCGVEGFDGTWCEDLAALSALD